MGGHRCGPAWPTQAAQACSPVLAAAGDSTGANFEPSNPPAGDLFLRTAAPAGQRFHWQLVSMWGAPLRQGTLLSHAGLQSVDVSGLPAGTMRCDRGGGSALEREGSSEMTSKCANLIMC